MTFPYGVDPDENPVVIRIHSFEGGYTAFPGAAVFLFPTESNDIPSANYTWNSALDIEVSSDEAYLYYFRVPDWGSYGSLTFARERLGGVPFPEDFTTLELGFVPTLDGVPVPLTREHMPEKLYVKTDDNYSGGIIEVGMYVGGVFRLLGSTDLSVGDIWTNSFVIDIEDPFDTTPRLHIRFADVDATGGSEGAVGIYTEHTYSSDQDSTLYKAALSFDQSSQNIFNGQDTYATSILFSRGQGEPHTDYLESSFIPLINGIPAPIDPESPPLSITMYSSAAAVGGNIQVGAYVGGEFVVMGQSDELLDVWDPIREEIQLTPVTGPVDIGGQVFIRLVNHDFSSDIWDYPRIAITLETTNSDSIATAVYSLKYLTFHTTISYGKAHYASGIHLWSVDFPSQGDLPTFRAITYSDGVKAEVNPLNPPPFIKAFAMYHSAGGKIQVGAYQENGEFFVMGEQDLPTIDDSETYLYDIPLIALPPPAVPYFWTGFLRTTEYVKGIDN